jgi:hypothetical protein
MLHAQLLWMAAAVTNGQRENKDRKHAHLPLMFRREVAYQARQAKHNRGSELQLGC